MFKWIYAAAASGLLVAGIYGVSRFFSAPETPVYNSAYENDDWTDFAEADIFLENMDW